MKKFTFIATGIVLGSICSFAQNTARYQPDCTLDFTTAEKFAEWTVVDGNPSSTPYVWTWNESDQAVTINSDKEAANDWIISPAVSLEAGKSYDITAMVKTDIIHNTQQFKITVGKTTSTDDQTTIILTNTDFSNNYYTEQTGKFTPSESGNYHFAVYCYAGKRNGDLTLQELSVKASPEFPETVTNLEATPGKNGALEATLTWIMPTKNTDGGTLVQLTGARIERMDASSLWNSFEEIGTVENSIPGAELSYTDNTISKAGPYQYRVIAYNNAGTAKPVASNEIWIGEDTPNPVTDITLTPEGNNILLNFTPPTTGKNNGYIDISALSYKIERIAGGTKTIIEEAYSGALPYKDDIAELNSYAYIVTVKTKSGTESEAVQSETLIAGPALTIPYDVTIDTKEKAALFSTYDANSDGRTWNFTSYSTKGFSYWGGTAADDWLITPPIAFEQGKVYKVTFYAELERGTESDYKTIEVAIGKDGLNMSSPFATHLVNSTFNTPFETTVNVQESGIWNVGFRVIGQTSYNSVYLTRIEIVESSIIPETIEDLTSVRGENGELSLTLNWTNPTKSNAGVALETISKYEIYRNGTLVHTKESPTPGAQETYTDTTIPDTGKYDYAVRVYLAELYSETLTTTEWIGEDTPTAVTELTATAENDRVTLSFAPPTTTVNNGWLNVDSMGYSITRNGETIEACYTGELPYIDTVTELNTYVYAVAPVTASGLIGEEASSNSVIAGLGIEPPYANSFPTKESFGLFTIVDANDDGNTWSYSTYDSAPEIGFGGEADDWIMSPNFSLTKGLEYEVKISADLNRALSEEDYKTLTITLGQGILPENQTETLTTFLVNSAMTISTTAKFFAAESGYWNIGIHCSGTINWRSLYLRGIEIQPTGESSASAIHQEAAIRYLRELQEIRSEQAGKLYVTNVNGIIVLSGENVISTQSLPTGVYIATLITKEGKHIQLKFIK